MSDQTIFRTKKRTPNRYLSAVPTSPPRPSALHQASMTQPRRWRRHRVGQCSREADGGRRADQRPERRFFFGFYRRFLWRSPTVLSSKVFHDKDKEASRQGLGEGGLLLDQVQQRPRCLGGKRCTRMSGGCEIRSGKRGFNKLIRKHSYE